MFLEVNFLISFNHNRVALTADGVLAVDLVVLPPLQAIQHDQSND